MGMPKITGTTMSKCTSPSPWLFPFEFSRRRRGDDSFRAAINVIKQNKIDFDLIHAHFTHPSGYVGARLKEIYDKKLILTVHEDRDWFLVRSHLGVERRSIHGRMPIR